MRDHPRMERERRTVRAMIGLYCGGQHGSTGLLCPTCQELRDYARKRLEHCPYQEGKTTCAKCPIHCYRPDMRERIRLVMRYAGPRMLLRHPLMTFQHLLDGRRNKPVNTRAAETAQSAVDARARVRR